MAKKKTVKKRKTKSKIILPPTMEQRGTQARDLALKIEGTWPPGCIHYCANETAVVAAFRPATVAEQRLIMDALKRIQTALL